MVQVSASSSLHDTLQSLFFARDGPPALSCFGLDNFPFPRLRHSMPSSLHLLFRVITHTSSWAATATFVLNFCMKLLIVSSVIFFFFDFLRTCRSHKTTWLVLPFPCLRYWVCAQVVVGRQRSHLFHVKFFSCTRDGRAANSQPQASLPLTKRRYALNILYRKASKLEGRLRFLKVFPWNTCRGSGSDVLRRSEGHEGTVRGLASEERESLPAQGLGFVKPEPRCLISNLTSPSLFVSVGSLRNGRSSPRTSFVITLSSCKFSTSCT